MNSKLRRGVVFVFSLLLLGSLCLYGGRLLWGNYQLRKADHHAADCNFDLAHDHASAGKTIFSNDPVTLLQCAMLARKASRFTAAQAHLQELANYPSHQQELAWEQLLLLAQQGELSIDQESRLPFLASADPGYRLPVAIALAQGFLQTYRPQEAHAVIQGLLAEHPEEAFHHYLHGLLRVGAQDLEAAIVGFQKAVELRPAFFAARLHLAETHLARNELASAAEQFELLVPQRPGNFRASFGRARCLRLQNRTEEAERLLEAMSRAHADQVALWHEWGALAMAASRLDDAETYFRTALKRDPHDPIVAFALGQCLRLQGRVDEASEWEKKHQALQADLDELRKLHEHIGRDPLAVEQRRRAAILCFRNGQDQEALRWLNSVLRLAPADRESHRLLADYYDRRGETARAEELRGHVK